MAERCFDFNGLDELKDDFSNLVKEYPDESEREIYRLAGLFTKDVNAKMPGDYSNSFSKRPLPTSWKRTREQSSFGSGTIGIEIENKAPHWHLVENGHVLKSNPQITAAVLGQHILRDKGEGKQKKKREVKTYGWVPGKGYCLRTREEWDNGIYAKYLKKFIKRLKKRHKL